MPSIIDQRPAASKFEQRDTFLDRATSDDEEVLAVGFGEATVALGNIGGDGKGCAVQLVNQKSVAAGELLGGRTNFVGKVQGLLVDQQLFELERHFATPKK